MKERTQVNISFSIVLDLLECHSGDRGYLLHDQICNQLDCHRSIYSLPAPQTHSVNLEVIFKPSPELLYGVMLLPDGYGFTSSQLPSEDHEAFELGTVHEEHQDHFAEGWAFRFLSGYWYTFASPGRIIQLHLLLMQRELLLLAIYGEYIVVLGMNHYLVKALLLIRVLLCIKARLFKYLHQAVRTIPTVEGDGKISQVNAFLTEYFHQLTDHFLEYLWFGRVTATLFTNRSNTQRYDPFTYLHGYGDDVLALHYIMAVSTEPTVSKTHEIAHSVYDGVINTEGNPHSGACCWTLGENFSYDLLYLGESSIQEQLSQMIYAPGANGAIDVVFVKTKNLYELIRREYIEYMSISQHEQNLHRFLVTSWEISVEKLLKLLNAYVNLSYHICLPMGLLAFHQIPPIRRPYFLFVVKGL